MIATIHMMPGPLSGGVCWACCCSPPATSFGPNLPWQAASLLPSKIMNLDWIACKFVFFSLQQPHCGCWENKVVCGLMVCALANAHCFLPCFWTGTRIRVEHVLRKGTYRRFERYWANGLYAEEMFSKQKRTSSQFFARDVKMMMYVSSAPCILRYEIFFSNDTTLTSRRV